jgi:hypothetical protein
VNLRPRILGVDARLQTSHFYSILFPDPPRRVPCERGINIALRTAHLMTFGILLGGHVFGIAPHRLILYLYLTIASGAGLIALELYRSCRWVYLGKGVVVVLKLCCLIAAGIWWEQRVVFLLLVVILGSVGSHMPSRLRHYSVLHGRVLTDSGQARLPDSGSSWKQ